MTVSNGSAGSTSWSVWKRTIVSVLVTLHLLAVITAPWADPPPSSELARWCASWFGPYATSIAIDNGYRFFAPDPGPSHLIRYEFLGPEGVIAESRFPDREEQWPRLFYHRNLMLAEMTSQITAGLPELPPDVDPRQLMSAEEWQNLQRERERVKVIHRSLADFLLSRKPEATAVRLHMITHALPSPFDVQRGMKLTDERLYEEQVLGEFPRQET